MRFKDCYNELYFRNLKSTVNSLVNKDSYNINAALTTYREAVEEYHKENNETNRSKSEKERISLQKKIISLYSRAFTLLMENAFTLTDNEFEVEQQDLLQLVDTDLKILNTYDENSESGADSESLSQNNDSFENDTEKDYVVDSIRIQKLKKINSDVVLCFSEVMKLDFKGDTLENKKNTSPIDNYKDSHSKLFSDYLSHCLYGAYIRGNDDDELIKRETIIDNIYKTCEDAQETIEFLSGHINLNIADENFYTAISQNGIDSCLSALLESPINKKLIKLKKLNNDTARKNYFEKLLNLILILNKGTITLPFYNYPDSALTVICELLTMRYVKTGIAAKDNTPSNLRTIWANYVMMNNALQNDTEFDDIKFVKETCADRNAYFKLLNCAAMFIPDKKKVQKNYIIGKDICFYQDIKEDCKYIEEEEKDGKKEEKIVIKIYNESDCLLDKKLSIKYPNVCNADVPQNILYLTQQSQAFPLQIVFARYHFNDSTLTESNVSSKRDQYLKIMKDACETAIKAEAIILG